MKDVHFEWDFINMVADFAKKNKFYFPICISELKGRAIDDEDMIEVLMLAVLYIIHKFNKEDK